MAFVTGLTLAQAFLEAAPGASPDAASQLAQALIEYVGVARRRWPQFAIDELEFVRHVAARSKDGRVQPVQHAADLLLAYACSRALANALDEFQRAHGPVIDRVLLHRKASTDLAADAKQIVQERLLVGDAGKGTAAKIGDYRGTGPLYSWVATTAATTLLTLRRSASRRREIFDSDQGSDQGSAESRGGAFGARLDPELDYLKQRYKGQVEDAIIEALRQLDNRESALLRLHLGERMSIDVLGSMYSVNRSTAARWLADARGSLISKAKAILRAQLNLTDRECDSMVALVQSQLHVSIVRRLSAENT